MDPAQSWERLSTAISGPFERTITGALVGAYRSLEQRIEIAYKVALEGGSEIPLQRFLILREQLGEILTGLRLPPELQSFVADSLKDGQQAGDLWALAQLGTVQKEAERLGIQQAAQLFADGATDPQAILTPAMARQNPSALIAAAQRQRGLSLYVAPDAWAALGRVAESDLHGRIIGAVEFHLAQGDSWRSLQKTLTNALGFAEQRAQMIARTEMAAAMVEGTKLRYEAEGIKQVQWQAVGSSRTCGYCAPRHGKVYRLEDVICPAHPACRCVVTPWEKEWLDLELIDAEEEGERRAAVLADLEAAGKKPLTGPSPFEKALGLQKAPEAIWSPPSPSSKEQS